MDEKRTIYQLPKYLSILLFLFVAPNLTSAQQKVLNIDQDISSMPIGKYVYIYKDVESVYKDSEITKVAQFEPENKDIPVTSNVTNATIWAKFKVVNTTADSIFFLDLQYSNLSEVTFYKYNGTALVPISITGNNFVFEKRTNRSLDFIFPLKLPKGQPCEFFLKIRSTHPILLPLFIKSKDKLDETINIQNLIFGLYFGIILSILFYNLFLFVSTRDLSYLFYIVYLFFLGIAQSILPGYGFKYFWPNSPFLNNYALVISTALASITGILFAIFFLRIAYYYRNFIFVLAVPLLLFFCAIVATISGNNWLGYNIINIDVLGTGLFLIGMSAFIWRKGYRAASYYLLAWISFLAGMIVLVLRNFNIVPYTNLTTYSSYIGSALEVILLSIALADRINSLRKEKEESQAYALKISRENENLIKEQNVMLEQKVTERTVELQSTNHQLSKALDDLKDAQIQLVEAEKMASLGQLTAGIAHEINNPINFVKSNIKPLRMDIDDLFEIIEEYNQLHSLKNDHLSKHLQEVYEREQSLDMNFVKDEIQQLLKGIEDGAERTAEIVRGLKTFSRLDESELKTANVHDGVESTLVLLRNSTPRYIKIERNFHAKGEIECYPGKLNQVFMNVLNNGMQAIAQKKEIAEEEYITISTCDTNDGFMKISIKDTGIGMTEEVRHRIYEPFFTTKEVGEGTGLGMSIVFKIIAEHGGKIEIVSEPQKGAEFILTLPHIHPES
jgi:two-component system NtrC family sensor kinase